MHAGVKLQDQASRIPTKSQCKQFGALVHSLSRYVIGHHNKRRYKAVLPTLVGARKGLIISQKEPNNLPTLFGQIESFIAPTETTGPRLTSDFRSHLEFPRRFD